MDNFIDEFVRIARRCERAARKYETDPVPTLLQRLHAAIGEIGASSSGMFLGHHACMYLQGFRPKARFDYYSNFEHNGPWVEYSADEVVSEILRRAGVSNTDLISETAKAANEAFEQGKNAVLPSLDALGVGHDDHVLRELRAKIGQLPAHVPEEQFAQSYVPSQQNVTWDDIRAGSDRLCVPPHLAFKARLSAMQSYGRQAAELAKQVHYAVKYLQARHQLKGNTVAKNDGKIFIGHGRSETWRDLKDFIHDRLKLDWDEFNREPAAGFTTKERLEAMLDNASFAFLVMTAEDVHADGSVRARENVIHEAGLFQGRLGFARAIILLEEGCAEFSNIVGLTQIRFSKGNLSARFEEIRRVLEREGLIG
jgi:predicted nucleotide-binding protein